jgi:hypothetical protein
MVPVDRISSVIDMLVREADDFCMTGVSGRWPPKSSQGALKRFS